MLRVRYAPDTGCEEEVRCHNAVIETVFISRALYTLVGLFTDVQDGCAERKSYTVVIYLHIIEYTRGLSQLIGRSREQLPIATTVHLF